MTSFAVCPSLTTSLPFFLKDNSLLVTTHVAALEGVNAAPQVSSARLVQPKRARERQSKLSLRSGAPANLILSFILTYADCTGGNEMLFPADFEANGEESFIFKFFRSLVKGHGTSCIFYAIAKTMGNDPGCKGPKVVSTHTPTTPPI